MDKGILAAGRIQIRLRVGQDTVRGCCGPLRAVSPISSREFSPLALVEWFIGTYESTPSAILEVPNINVCTLIDTIAQR